MSDIDDAVDWRLIARKAQAEIVRLRDVLQSLTKDPPAHLAREPDTDAEVIIKMREIARCAIACRGTDIDKN